MIGGIRISRIGDYIKRTDVVYWLLTLTASVFGCLLIASTQRDGEVDFLKTQIFAILIGYGAAIVISAIDYNVIAKCWWLTGGVAIALTVMVFYIGIQVAGTDDVGWIRLPGGLTFQPSELTKICFILTFSKHLSYLAEHDKLHRFRWVMTLVIHAAVPVVMIHMQGDDGAALVFGCMFLIMSFAAGVQLRYFIALIAAAGAALPLMWFGVLNEDQKNRLMVLFSDDPAMLQSYGWQQYQGKISIASGGVTGKGLFSGPRVGQEIVPYQENDFIFTVAGEELGFIGCAAILLLFVLIMIFTLRTAAVACNMQGRLICTGFFALLATQAAVNIGMVLGLLPVVGITLPFFSSGGSSAACLYLGVGLVQSVYMHPSDNRDIPVKAELSHTVRGTMFPA